MSILITLLKTSQESQDNTFNSSSDLMWLILELGQLQIILNSKLMMVSVQALTHGPIVVALPVLI